MNKRRTFFIIFISVLSVCTSINDISNRKHVTGCEDQVLKLKCEGDNKITILSGNFGRASASVCIGNNDANKNVNCYYKNTVAKLKEICEGEQQCDVQASNDVFGDSCPRTYKYLDVFYSCVAFKDTKYVTACEDHVLKLKCEVDNKITILFGNYGRTTESICIGNNDGNKYVKCYNENTLATLKEICEGEQQCDVKASNDVFGDPCRTAYKYLDILYRCVGDKDFKQALACDGGHVKLECHKRQLIRILEANYGRKSRHICTNGSIYINNCVSTTTKDIVSEKCNNVRKCDLYATRDVFGDPCYGTHKYLSVKYKCLREGFICNDGEIIPKPSRCDGFKDCSGGDDELQCDNHDKFSHEDTIHNVKPEIPTIS